jgi:phosphate:Na+ symporter
VRVGGWHRLQFSGSNEEDLEDILTPMRRILLSLALAVMALGATAQSATTPSVSGEVALHRSVYLDENGEFRDVSGDGAIYANTAGVHWGRLQIQVAPRGASLPASRPGVITRRPGLSGMPILVEGPENVELRPGDENLGWETDRDGVLEVSFRVPDRVGDYAFTFKTENAETRTLTLHVTVKSANWLLWLGLGMMGGLALLLYGMQIGSEGLQAAGGKRLRETLHTVTRSPTRSVVVGTVLTFLTQSSSATTLMLVGFVRAELMSLRQSLGVIFGAAIGTTLTVQLISFNIQAYSLPLIAVGYALFFLFGKSERVSACGKVLFGFGLVFFGMAVMGEVIEPLRSSPVFRSLLALLTDRPFYCLMFATLFTALIHSSAATVGIALTLANQDLLTLPESLPIIFGAAIGTCITAFMAAMGGVAEGLRVAWAHLLYKIGMVALFFFWPMNALVVAASERITGAMGQTFPDVALFADNTGRQMANAYTLLTVIAMVVAVLFFRGVLERMVMVLVPAADDEKKEGRAKYLDLAQLDSPQLALGAAVREISRMGRLVEEMAKATQPALEERNTESLEWLSRRDDKVDRAFMRINNYLTQLTTRKLDPDQMNRAIGLLYVINDLESIGDLIVKIYVPLVGKMIDQDLNFSEEGMREMRDLHAKVTGSLSQTILALTTGGDKELFEEVIRRHDVLQALGRKLHLSHLRRLREGQQETVETSSVHMDMVNYLLRQHYHVFSIAWTASRGVSAHEDIS